MAKYVARVGPLINSKYRVIKYTLGLAECGSAIPMVVKNVRKCLKTNLRNDICHGIERTSIEIQFSCIANVPHIE